MKLPKLNVFIVKPMGAEIYSEEEFSKKKRSMSIVIGNLFSRNPIFKKRILKGKKIYKVKIEDFSSLLEAKAFLKPIKEILNIEGDKGDSGDRGGEEMGKRQDIDFETDWEFLAYKQVYKLLSPLSPHTTLSPDTPLSPYFEFKLFEEPFYYNILVIHPTFLNANIKLNSQVLLQARQS